MAEFSRRSLALGWRRFGFCQLDDGSHLWACPQTFSRIYTQEFLMSHKK